ncbi:hypothetical protein [Actinomadura rugatobispora]|uniref:DUF4241 domain-containing protein n=1 Tax=Actinomadura rugatobispora TaxID=1994 RepID=A0ABW1AF43_9ACTN|nr:hypothetical protein GCM10010200_025120 [Actinomadura rugatobispora]
MTGYWELEAYTEARELCASEGVDTRPYVQGWLDDPALPEPGGFLPVNGFVLHIAADGTATEYAAGRVRMPWWESEVVLDNRCEPFNGEVVRGKDALYFVPDEDENGEVEPNGYHYGNGSDCFATARLTLDEAGRLVRTVSVDFEMGFLLTRLWYRYARVDAPTRPRPRRIEDAPAPSSIDEAVVVPVPANIASALAEAYRSTLAGHRIAGATHDDDTHVTGIVEYADLTRGGGQNGMQVTMRGIPALGHLRHTDPFGKTGEALDEARDLLCDHVFEAHADASAADWWGTRRVSVLTCYREDSGVFEVRAFAGPAAWGLRREFEAQTMLLAQFAATVAGE